MNANDMFEAIQKSWVCEGLEDWIKTELFPRMCKSHDMKVIFNERSITWDRYSFVRDMERLGYRIDYDCDDRPAAQPYYTVSIPQ